MTQTPNTGSAAKQRRGRALEILLGVALLLLAAQIGWIVVEYWTGLPAPGRQVEIRSPDAPYPYLVFLPEGYAAGDRRWPLILHLHGSGERGHDLRAVRTTSLPRLLDRGRRVPAIVVSPQCPPGETWSAYAIMGLADALTRRFAIDQRRLYATGYSMGGYATWEVGCTFPRRIAAIVPICGGGPAAWGPRLASLPTWAFHGARDDAVAPDETIKLVEAMRQAGGTPRLTIYDNLGHGIWDRVYATDEVYEWLWTHETPAEPDDKDSSKEREHGPP
jgi:predicted peptidase